MRIDEIHIDGFGVFHDHHFEEVGPGLTVFFGPNEAGKTTLLNFVKRVLFGFPDGRYRGNHFPPLEGGRHGGRLVLTTESGIKYTVQRFAGEAATTMLEDGMAGSEADLRSCLGNATSGIYESIYAFGLEELHDIDVLSSDSMKDMMYGAGTGIKGTSLSDLRKDIEEKTGDLYKPKGRKPKINLLLKGIKDARKELAELQVEVEGYDSLHQDMEDSLEHLSSINSLLGTLDGEVEHLEALRAAWEDWCVIQESRERLCELPDIEDFPPNGIETLEGLNETIEQLEMEREEKEAEIRTRTARLDSIEVDTAVIEVSERIKDLERKEAKYRSSMDDIGELEAQLREERGSLDSLLDEVGPDWNVDRLLSFDTSIPFRERVRDHREARMSRQERKREASEVVSSIERELERNGEELAILEDRLDRLEGEEMSTEEMDSRRRDLQTLRHKTHELEIARQKKENLEEREGLLRMMRPAPRAHDRKPPQWPTALLIGMGGISMILGLLSDALVLGFVLGGVLIASGIGYLLQTRSGMVGSVVEDGGPMAEDGETRGALENQRKELAKQITSHEGDINAALNRLDMDGAVSDQVIDQALLNLQETAHTVTERRELARDKEAKRLARESMEASLDETRDELKRVEEEVGSFEHEWETWLRERELPEDLSDDTILEMVKTIQVAQERHRGVVETQERIDRIRTFMISHEEDYRALLSELDKSNLGDDVLLGTVRLAEALEASIENRREADGLQERLEELGGELERLTERLDGKRMQLSELLEAAGASDVAEFRRRAANWEEISELKEAIRSAEAAIRRVAGPENLESMMEELSSMSPEEVSTSLLRLMDRKEELKTEMGDLRERMGGIKKEIERLERSEEASRLRQEVSAETERLHSMSREWMTSVLARHILSKAVERYERERQPGVIREAQSFFKGMTLDCYPTMMAPLGEECVYIEAPDRSRKSVSELSRGTKEQLYLALRFGYINELGSRTERLPLIFDDILVNFDDNRLKAACEAIGELARSNQVMFFTCHRATMEVLEETVEGCMVVDLATT